MNTELALASLLGRHERDTSDLVTGRAVEPSNAQRLVEDPHRVSRGRERVGVASGIDLPGRPARLGVDARNLRRGSVGASQGHHPGGADGHDVRVQRCRAGDPGRAPVPPPAELPLLRLLAVARRAGIVEALHVDVDLEHGRVGLDPAVDVVEDAGDGVGGVGVGRVQHDLEASSLLDDGDATSFGSEAAALDLDVEEQQRPSPDAADLDHPHPAVALAAAYRGRRVRTGRRRTRRRSELRAPARRRAAPAWRRRDGTARRASLESRGRRSWAGPSGESCTRAGKAWENGSLGCLRDRPGRPPEVGDAVARKGRARRFREARELKQGFDDGLFTEGERTLADADNGDEAPSWRDEDDDDHDDWDEDDPLRIDEGGRQAS